MTTRIRTYPYKVTYINLQDYLVTPIGGKLLIITETVIAKNSEEAKSIITGEYPTHNLAFFSSTRYPKHLGTVSEATLTAITPQQIKALKKSLQASPIPAVPNKTAVSASSIPWTVSVGPSAAVNDAILSVGGFTVGADPNYHQTPATTETTSAAAPEPPTDDFPECFYATEPKDILVDKLQIAVQIGVNTRLQHDYPMIAENLEVTSQRLAHLSDCVVYTFSSFLANIHKQDKETTSLYKYPATPWEFFKEKYAPQWFLKRWPTRYESKNVITWCERNFMCPHMSMPSDRWPHVLWLYEAPNYKAPIN
jgi:hypothetical protein